MEKCVILTLQNESFVVFCKAVSFVNMIVSGLLCFARLDTAA